MADVNVLWRDGSGSPLESAAYSVDSNEGHFIVIAENNNFYLFPIDKRKLSNIADADAK